MPHTKDTAVKNIRKSGIELLKVFGILLVVLSHVVQTLGTAWGNYTYYVNFQTPTRIPLLLLLSILRHSGALGNTIFFICSAWFLLDSKKTNFQKILRMLADVWIISVLWLITALLIGKAEIPEHLIRFSFLPTIKQNNWYISYYILFCFVYPPLNMLLRSCKQKLHLILTIVFLVCLCTNCFFGFPSIPHLAQWCMTYVCIAYFKRYGERFCNSTKANVILLLVGIFGTLTLFFATNIVGLKHPELKISLLKWAGNSNVFMMFFSFAALLLLQRLTFRSKTVNFISGLSMLVYLIHENIIFRQLYRPIIWQWIYERLGYKLLILWVLLFVAVLFTLSCLLSIAYKYTLQKAVHFISDKLYALLVKLYGKCFQKIREKKPPRIHEMNLQNAPFAHIQRGTKRIEMRLFDEKRQALNIGDVIRFTSASGEHMSCIIIALHRFPDFQSLYAHFDKTALGYEAEEVANPDDMLRYYPQEEMLRYGVVGIEIQLIV